VVDAVRRPHRNEGRLRRTQERRERVGPRPRQSRERTRADEPHTVLARERDREAERERLAREHARRAYVRAAERPRARAILDGREVVADGLAQAVPAWLAARRARSAGALRRDRLAVRFAGVGAPCAGPDD